MYFSKYSEILEKHKLLIVKGLRLGDVADVDRITDKLVSDGTLRPEVKQAIQAKKTRGQKVLALIGHLQENPTPASFESFLQCLEWAGHGGLAELIRNS